LLSTFAAVCAPFRQGDWLQVSGPKSETVNAVKMTHKRCPRVGIKAICSLPQPFDAKQLCLQGRYAIKNAFIWDKIRTVNINAPWLSFIGN